MIRIDLAMPRRSHFSRESGDVYENKQVNQFYPGMLLINKVVSHFSGLRQFRM